VFTKVSVISIGYVGLEINIQNLKRNDSSVIYDVKSVIKTVFVDGKL
jgi:hypothetical protein